jgi:hypothetical protein
MEFKQASFSGGMNLLVDDTRLPVESKYKLGDNPYDIGYNQYREAFNVRNRYDVLRPILNGDLDYAAPVGIKQEITTFGNYIILFVGGFAFYRYYTDTGWRQIVGFRMSTTAPRYWTCVIPLGTTNYVRLAKAGVLNTLTTNPAGGVELSTVQGAAAGNNPGLLVQDNINQSQFIFLDNLGNIQVRTTQSFTQWYITYTTDANTAVAVDVYRNILDNREYVPIGNAMAWNNGVLYITSKDFGSIYRSVSGRPLDFVINITNHLATNAGIESWTYVDPITGKSEVVSIPPLTQIAGGSHDTTFFPGGDATTTSYSVGVGGIACIRPMASGGLFVAASNANFSVTPNTTPNAPTLFGEYTLVRTFLFNATCLSDRAILDSVGDTKFIDLTGIRSFNAVQQQQNEGRNSQFSATVNAAFSGITQDPSLAACILYDNYELYAINTIFGSVILVFDTILGVWTSFDTTQTGGKRIKALSKIELTIQRLYAITEDDKFYTLYQSVDYAPASVRLGSYASVPNTSHNVNDIRLVLNNITADCTVSAIPFTDNRLSKGGVQTKDIYYKAPVYPYTGLINMADLNTQVSNVLFSFPNGQTGWKSFPLIEWTGGGSLTYVSMNIKESQTMNPLMSQVSTK